MAVQTIPAVFKKWITASLLFFLLKKQMPQSPPAAHCLLHPHINYSTPCDTSARYFNWDTYTHTHMLSLVPLLNASHLKTDKSTEQDSAVWGLYAGCKLLRKWLGNSEIQLILVCSIQFHPDLITCCNMEASLCN